MDRAELIESGRPLALWIAGRYGGTEGNPYRDDLRSVAMVALVRSAATFNPDRGSWSTYLTTAVRRACHRELRRLSACAYVPDAARPELRPRAATPGRNHDGEEVDAVDMLQSTEPGPDERAEVAEVVATIRAAVAMLRRRDAAVIRLRYLGDEVRTLDQVAPLIGVSSRERVRQIEGRALGTLRRMLR